MVGKEARWSVARKERDGGGRTDGQCDGEGMKMKIIYDFKKK